MGGAENGLKWAEYCKSGWDIRGRGYFSGGGGGGGRHHKWVVPLPDATDGGRPVAVGTVGKTP